ncbi:MAG: GntR family transcriptional regulator [Lachnospiraceae bacterium]|nr:GntR family transcriptional regulator [Lachnospiraceae bacterium]
MEFKSNTPIYLQVIDDIKSRILAGEICPGEKLPSSRELALQYDINPNTAARIYTEMERMGLSYTKRGIGTFVAENPKAVDEMKEEAVEKVLGEFIQNMSNLGFDKETMIKELTEYLSK